MFDRNKPRKTKNGDKHPRKEPKDKPQKDEDDELSIEELEDCGGGTGNPPPEPNAAC